MEGLAATPRFGCEPLDCSVVDCLRIAFICFGVEKVVDVLGQNRRDGMHSFVPAQTLSCKTHHCPNNRLQVFSQLILHNDMEDGMRLQPWQLYASQPVMLLDERVSVLFVECKP